MCEPMSFEVVAAGDRSLDSSEFSLLGGEILQTSSSPQCSLDQEEVERRLVDLLQDNQAMKDALQVNNNMMKEQLSIISAWHSQMTASMSQQQLSLREAKEKLMEAQEENKLLSMKLQKVESSKKDDASPDDFEFVTQKQTEDLNTMKSLLEETKEELAKQISEHSSEIREKEQITACLHEKFDKSLKEVNHLQQQLEVERNRNEEVLKSLSCVQEDYDRVTKLIQIQSRDQKEHTEMSSAEAGLVERRHQEEVDDLMARLLDLEQRLEEKAEQQQVMNGELESLRKETEQLPILKAQVEVYKSELGDTSQSKDTSGETSSDATHGDRYRDRRHKSKHGVRRFEVMEASGSDMMIICPICNFGFTDLQAAENHVNSCIDKPNT